MHILTDSAIRTYCFLKNECDEAWEKASYLQKEKMQVMAVFKNFVPVDTVIFCMRQWHLLEKMNEQEEGNPSRLTLYLGESNQYLKEKLQQWLSVKDQKITAALANYIVLVATGPRTKGILREIKYLSVILGAVALIAPMNDKTISAREAFEASAFYLVGAGLLFAIETSIGQLAIKKAKTYYEGAKTKAQSYYEVLRKRFWPKGKTE